MRGGIREYWTHILHLGCLLAPLRSLAVSPGRQRRGGGCRGGVYFTRHFPVNLGSPWLIMQPLNLIPQISSLPWKGNGRQSLPLSPLLGPGKLAEKLPLVAQAPGVGSDSSLFIFCLACWTHSLVSAQGDWDLSYTSLFQKRALSGAREG